MKLRAEKYFVQSHAHPGDEATLPPNALKVRYKFDIQETTIDDQGFVVPIDFDLYEWKLGQPLKKYGLNTNFTKFTPDIFPGETLVIKLLRRDQWFDECNPEGDACREIRIYGISEPVNFGIKKDIMTEVGGTYFKVDFFTTEKTKIIAYKTIVDYAWSITSQPALSLLSDKSTIYIHNTVDGNRHSLYVPNLLPGNNYALFVLLVDEKGNWQIFEQAFTTKQRQVNIKFTKLITEYVGDGDGIGDASFFLNQLTLSSANGMPNNKIFPIWWYGDHTAGNELDLRPYPYHFQFPFQKYTEDIQLIIRTQGREGNGLDTDGFADSEYVEGALNFDNGKITPHLPQGIYEAQPKIWGVKAQSEQGRGSLFVYHLQFEILCQYQ